ncbi:hypothetical protein GF325_13445 [Candidatus Bathyarchaeota archaeon]|nr:hypothetical protein [Candidatus Bathyarchaeota archaeon]
MGRASPAGGAHQETLQGSRIPRVGRVLRRGLGSQRHRKGLFKLLRDVTRGKHDVVVVNYQDRLSRFGLNVIREHLSGWNVSLEVIHPTVVDDTPHAGLITDLTAILYSFIGRLYRSRRGKQSSAGEGRQLPRVHLHDARLPEPRCHREPPRGIGPRFRHPVKKPRRERRFRRHLTRVTITRGFLYRPAGQDVQLCPPL